MDYRTSSVGRRRSWYGLKKYVKRALSLRVPHAAMRTTLRCLPPRPEAARLPAPASVKEVTGHVQGARFVMLRPDRCEIAKELYWGRGRRPRPEAALAVELFATMARDADVMFDIGAYTGLFTLIGTSVNPDLSAHAFEMVPDVYRALFDNCVRNNVLRRATLHHAGVGEENATMRIPATSAGSALPSFYSRRLQFDSGVPVRFRSLDSLADVVPAASRVLMKVDVEGTEHEVFLHGQRFLAEFRPAIVCEVLHGVARAEEVQSLLAPHGYHHYLIREDDLLPSLHVVPHPRFREWLFSSEAPDAVAARGVPVAPPTE